MNDIPPCPVCGEYFENVFEATDHLLEDGEPEFDPKLILPGGYSLMVGSLLRCIYANARNPEEIEFIAQNTYATLYAAETDSGEMQKFIENLIVREQMSDIDEELEELLDNGHNDNESGA